MSEEGTTATLETGTDTPASSSGDLIDSNASAAPTTQTDVLLSDVYLPDDIKNNPSITPIKTVTDLAKRTINAESLVGADKVVIPGKDATPQDWEEVYKKLGRPDTPETYNLKPTPDLPEGVISEDRVKEYAAKVHELGLSTKQTNELFQWYQDKLLGDQTAMDEVQSQQAENAAEQLKREYGNAFDEKVRLANSVFRNTNGGDEARAAIKEKGLDNDTRIIKWAIELGAAMGEDRMLGLDGGRGGQGAQTPDAAQAKIKELMSKPAYADKYHAEHETVMAEVKTLLADAHPETP